MKQKLAKVLLLVAVLFSVSSAASAQIYVRIRPVVPIIVRTERPSPDRVWVDEDWQRNDDGDGYRYSGGHWAAPPRDDEDWHQGHWKHNHRGDKWMHGGWGRRRD